MARRSTARSGKKLFYKIGEVCELTDTEPYVLRYWESEFPFLAPEKNRAGQRIYSDADIETVNAIKRLLYEEGYTTAGARRKLEQRIEAGGSPGVEPEPEGGEALPPEAGGVLARVREGLGEIRDLLTRPVDLGRVTAGEGDDSGSRSASRSTASGTRAASKGRTKRAKSKSKTPASRATPKRAGKATKKRAKKATKKASKKRSGTTRRKR